jgi:hypothetical protein
MSTSNYLDPATKAARPKSDRVDVNSCGAEFGYELISVIPFAYYLHTVGRLRSTASAPQSAPFYYFSPRHEETQTRDWHTYRQLVQTSNIPNKRIHSPMLDTAEWLAPPYKTIYNDSRFAFDVIIMNKFSYEWKSPPVNFIDLTTLRLLFARLTGKRVLYIRLTGSAKLDDAQSILDLNEWNMIKEFPHVATLQSLASKHQLSYNEAQLRCLAGCSQFVSVQGGTSILASYFGGTNIVLVRKCGSLARGGYNYYWRLGNSALRLCHSSEELVAQVTSSYGT